MADHTLPIEQSQQGAVEPPNPNSIGGSKYRDLVPVSNSPLVVGVQVDTAYLNYQIDPLPFLAKEQELAAWKLEAQAAPERVKRLDLGGLEYFISAAGRRHYAYLLTVPGYGELMLSFNERFRGARVRLFSEWLAGAVDVAAIEAGARALVAGLLGTETIMAVQASEFHVCADVTGWLPTIEDLQLDRWKCSADMLPVFADWATGVIHSWGWGKHGAPISASIYDKGREIAQQSEHKAYLLDKWRSAGWDGEAPVYRLEFRFTRERLREFGVDHPEKLDPAGLFAYGMSWLELRVPASNDSNKSRWAIDPVWSAISAQAVKLLGEQWAQYKRERLPNASVDMLTAQITGCLACVGALAGVDDLDDLFAFARAKALQRAQQTGLEFGVMVAERCDRYQVPLVPGARGRQPRADHPAVCEARRD